tara:strand:+ start:1521 stop:1787 length:267 start_codon:yes stop_codon:yes gene_type:complete
LLIKAVECKECTDIVYSRTEDDFRECSCGSIGVSGGVKYFKFSAQSPAGYEVKKINIKTTLDNLYEDWYNMRDEFGLIQQETAVQAAQ